MKVVVVGGGLVGSLASIILQKMGNQVELYEQRPDIRNSHISSHSSSHSSSQNTTNTKTTKTTRGRSINLALSERGIQALKAAGVYESVLPLITPMYGRTLHTHTRISTCQNSTSQNITTKTEFVPYGVYSHQCINSIDRLLLNQMLLDEAEKCGVYLNFNHKLKQADFSTNTLQFTITNSKSSSNIQSSSDTNTNTTLTTNNTLTTTFELCVGADGAYSSIRNHVMKQTRMNYTQEYIEHGYLELSINPIYNPSPSFAMHENSLHIWPRHEFMMIALPNKDASFTVTLFMPFSKFNQLKSDQDVIEFFQSEFPDALDLIGHDYLLDLYFNNPIGSLISVKCDPYNYKNVVFLGDASHAMVPFYGQGMNCGFEDVLVLLSCLYGPHKYLPLDSQPHLLHEYNHDNGDIDPILLHNLLDTFSKFRHSDATAMCDLAMYNYFEMRSNVLSLGYRTRKTLETWLHRLFPTRIIPLYTMVSFTQIRYSHVIEQWKNQTRLFNLISVSLLFTSLTAAALTFKKYLK